MEVRLLLRNGEQLVLAIVIPVLVLVGGVVAADRIGIDLAHRPVDELTPGVLALAIMSTSFTSVAIATGFERRYGVLKRLGATPLPRLGCSPPRCSRCWWSRCCSCPGAFSGGARAGVVTVGRGRCGRVRAGVVAGHCGVRVARAAAGGYVARRGDAGRRQPHLPAAARRRSRGPAEASSYGAFGSFAQWLPSGALGDAMRAAFIDGSIAWASLLCLAVWAVVGGYLTSRTFKWE